MLLPLLQDETNRFSLQFCLGSSGLELATEFRQTMYQPEVSYQAHGAIPTELAVLGV